MTLNYFNVREMDKVAVKIVWFCYLILSVSLITTSVQAEETAKYDELALNAFWKKLYPGDGW